MLLNKVAESASVLGADIPYQTSKFPKVVEEGRGIQGPKLQNVTVTGVESLFFA